MDQRGRRWSHRKGHPRSWRHAWVGFTACKIESERSYYLFPLLHLIPELWEANISSQRSLAATLAATLAINSLLFKLNHTESMIGWCLQGILFGFSEAQRLEPLIMYRFGIFDLWLTVYDTLYIVLINNLWSLILERRLGSGFDQSTGSLIRRSLTYP